ncbi:hypothetical protein K1719_033624 [Acacia pycnantha]|nr:hypothetical protein K1719_033624 [Acacia pycnantha]
MQLYECCKGLKTDSKLWRKLTQLWPSIVENIYWDIGDGNEVKFWEDKWVEDEGGLAGKCLGHLSEEEKRVTVSEMLNERGEWDMDRIQDSLNEEGRELVRAIPPPSVDNGKDSIKWGRNFGMEGPTKSSDFPMVGNAQSFANGGAEKQDARGKWRLFLLWTGGEHDACAPGLQ